ncbi:MAG: ATP-binding protein [Campylobacterales bacterium]
MQLQKLPIGIETFGEIRKNNYAYIDKTNLAYKLVNSYKYVFLSRPRRFGKSLFLDTLKNIFEGNREYFKNLAIEDKWGWETSYPVIQLNFAKGKIQSRAELDNRIMKVLKSNQKRLNIECEDSDDVAGCFSDIIEYSYEKYNQRVVVLIDEYDKPILDNITKPEVAKEIRDGLVSFYSVIKGSDKFLRFAFLTGVSKFTKTSIFSGLNNIVDISLDQAYGDICGYSQDDIETTFKPYLEGVDMQKLKCWYNGYNFLGSSMYNPFDILQFIAKEHQYKNYWFETGTPTFLMELIEKNNYFLPNLSNLKADERLLNSFDIENLDLEVILYQTGYLSIDTVETTPFETLQYKLKIPNKEVRLSLSDYIIDYLLKDKRRLKNKIDIYNSLLEDDMENLKLSLISMFASIPYNNYINNEIQNYEGFYASIVYVYLQSLGVDIIGEDVSNRGRIDLTIKMERTIYIIEFKVDAKKGEALTQIKTNEYAKKYLNLNKAIYLVGIEFDSNEKNIVNLEWEKIR